MMDIRHLLPATRALDGTLLRQPDGVWHWRDGAPEPRVRDMTLRDLAPSYRCITYGARTSVELPHDWYESRHWPHGVGDARARKAIHDMIADGCAEPAAIYAEGIAEMLDEHRAAKHGYLIPVAVWDEAMAFVCGAWWDKADEADILARAAALRT